MVAGEMYKSFMFHSTYTSAAEENILKLKEYLLARCRNSTS